MSYCVEKGIPHEEWLSWSPESRAKHTAFLLEQASSCQLCGTAQWEWEENRFAYEPEEAFCPGCYMKDVAGEGRTSLPGTTINLVPVTQQRRDQQLMLSRRRRHMTFDEEQ